MQRSLTFYKLAGFCLLLAMAVAFPLAAPTEAVEAAVLPIADPMPEDTLIVAELFSSQACVFCPRADRLFMDIAAQDNIIALACHVDYFDVSEGALSHPFCTARQSDYTQSLQSGPNYTPQLIVNGRYDVVGYKYQEVLETLRRAGQDRLAPIRISPLPLDHEDMFQVSLALPPDQNPEDTALWIAYIDRPHNITIAQGRNRGEMITYKNILSSLQNLGPVPAGMFSKSLQPDMKDSHAGFALILQNTKTGHIIAAGRYERAL